MSLNTTLFEGEYAAIPALMRDGIMRWVEQGVKPGQFLWAVICNDLRVAVAAADEENLALLPLYVRWFHWQCPAGVSGSPEAAAWHRASRQPAGAVKSE